MTGYPSVDTAVQAVKAGALDYLTEPFDAERLRALLAGVREEAITEPLFESEVFGHVRGAFTGAATDKAGLFEAAHHGTIVLDEIGELGPAVQAKLLRTLETGEVLRVGATAPTVVDVRVIAMTNRDLRDEMAEGRFRSDLFYRLDVMRLSVPPLCERMEDVPYLTAAFVQEFSTRFGKDIREAAARRALRSPSDHTLADLERDHIAQVLAACDGNKARAARSLGLDRRSLYGRIERYGLGTPASTSD